jgi:hypothetical protein
VGYYPRAGGGKGADPIRSDQMIRENPASWVTYLLTYTPLPKRRVRDVGGPSPAAARVERCVNVTNSSMARPDGSSASATARQHVFQLPLLPKLFHSQSCGHKQLDMLSLLLGRSRPDGQLVPGSSLGAGGGFE